MNDPLITVIMPCLNREKFIAEAVESVLAQGYSNFEYIAIDGGSTDGTLEILASYPQIRVICEKDRSLYDALNKGVRAATGTVIAHLNTDDIFPEGTFRAVADEYIRDPELDCVYGGSAVFRDGTVPRTFTKVDNDFEKLQFNAHNGAFTSIGINARFFHRRVYESAGLYDWTYRIAGDREFFLRTIFSGNVKKAVYLDRILFHYRHHSGSLTFNDAKFSESIAKEHLRMIDELTATYGHRFTTHELRVMKKWHTEESLRLMNWRMKNRRGWPALQTGYKGWTYDPTFPLAFALASTRILFGLPRSA
jgi:glycosyltransferase involved in cell wall biosynthesis